MNQLPGVLADLADDSGNARDATAARWDATAAAQRAVWLRRVVVLPAIPRIGDLVYVEPYSDELHVEEITWNIDPEDGETMVSVRLSDINFDVIGDDDDALEMFLEAGWVTDPMPG
jgi:hypothetical protein